MDRTYCLFFASVRKYSLDFDENLAFVFEFLIAFGIMLKISAARFFKILELVEDAICGAVCDLRCLLFSLNDISMYSGFFKVTP